ncbi:MAG: hypothetical protein LQ348_004366 [Seirophora lacunosa]|nr:MAG: hypothetical protein LQ348_004366 [Seirophora lacunosa]
MPRLPHLLRIPSKLHRRARRSRLFTMLLLLLTIITLILPFYIVYKPPNILIRYFQYRWPDVLWHVPSATSKTIALTIDDGPSDYTEEIVEILKSNGATATFFVIGAQVKGREELLRGLLREGNELGNHAMHDEPSRFLSNDALKEQIGSVEKMVQEAYTAVQLQAPPKYFRPGSGLFNSRIRRVVSELGYRLVLGSVYPHDPQIPYWRVNAKHVLSMLRPGAIIICHDRRKWTAPMLRKVLPEAKRRGYRVVTVTKLLEEANT